MESEKTRAGPRGRQEALLRLLSWEYRHLQPRWSAAWWMTWTAVGLAVVISAWWAAGKTDPQAVTPGLLHSAAVAVLAVTPLQDKVARLGQMTFGYGLLRFIVDFAAAFARLTLPALASGTVVRDRKSGRLEELQLAGLSGAEIYLGKSLAAAWLFLGPALWLLAILVGVLILDAVRASEAVRLSLELTVQVLLTAMVSVALSAASQSVGAALLKAYGALWLVVPGVWILLSSAVFLASGGMAALDARFPYITFRPVELLAIGLMAVGAGFTEPCFPVPLSFPVQCMQQAAFTTFVCLAAFLLGAKRLSVTGLTPGIGSRMRGWTRQLGRIGRGDSAAEGGGEHAHRAGGAGV
jgi:hypothetical protein